MAVSLSEEWIRERVNLKHHNLDEVRSLSLPGTYHEKIVHLDGALKHFTRLKHLDLSRNAIDSLEGLVSLKLLEKLNLYYNNISSLDELYRLKHNQQLQELDLRLNPVARNEPDYRLFLIHLLPNLRRLDDRGVRDSERKAALMHFSTEKAAEWANKPRPTERPEKPTYPRVEHVKSLAKPLSALDDDDVAILDIISKNNDLGKLTGSSAKTAQVQGYPPAEVRQMDLAGIGIHGADYIKYDPPILQIPTSDKPGADYQYTSDSQPTEMLSGTHLKYPNLSALTSLPTSTGSKPPLHPPQQTCAKSNRDANLKFYDEVEAYTSYTAKGHFTPANGQTESVQAKRQDTEYPHLSSATSANDNYKTLNNEKFREPVWKNQKLTKSMSVEHLILNGYPEPGHISRETASKISDLVDKYWNGSRSLLSNKRFLGQLSVVLQEWGRTAHLEGGDNIRRLQEEVNKLQDENLSLRSTALNSVQDAEPSSEAKLKSALVRAQRDLNILKTRLARSLNDNKALEERLEEVVKSQQELKIHQNSEQLEHLRIENEKLKQQIRALTSQLGESAQFRDLAHMLQESHKSLIQTNSHLVKELEAVKKANQSNSNNYDSFQPLSYATSAPYSQSTYQSYSSSDPFNTASVIDT